MTAGAPPAASSSEINRRVWAERDHLREYANRSLKPVEVLLLARYRSELSGRVLDIGCGAGRILGYLVQLGAQVHGIDISARMVEYCRSRYPEAAVDLADARQLPEIVTGPFSAVVCPDNTLDVFGPEDRLNVLRAIRALLAPDGVFIFSTHNLTDVEAGLSTKPAAPGPRWRRVLDRVLHAPIGQLLGAVRRVPQSRRNRRRLRDLEVRGDGYAILNDPAANWSVLHYYIRRQDQERQLQDLGLELVECLDDQGRPVADAEAGRGPWLYYVARPRPA